MVYWTCSLCGANLDPEEHCDCEKENAREAATSESGKSETSIINLTQNSEGGNL